MTNIAQVYCYSNIIITDLKFTVCYYNNIGAPETKAQKVAAQLAANIKPQAISLYDMTRTQNIMITLGEHPTFLL